MGYDVLVEDQNCGYLTPDENCGCLKPTIQDTGKSKQWNYHFETIRLNLTKKTLEKITLSLLLFQFVL